MVASASLATVTTSLEHVCCRQNEPRANQLNGVEHGQYMRLAPNTPIETDAQGDARGSSPSR